MPTLLASVANLVVFVAYWPGSALTSRRELIGAGCSLTRGLTVAAGGAVARSVLLLSTPRGAFSRVAPFLVATGALALAMQPWLTTRLQQQPHQAGIAAWLLVRRVPIYSGYFGAGAGIVQLAVLLVVIDNRLPEANA